MGEKTLNIRIKNKYDTEANWTKNDPVLLAGETAYSSDKSGKYKIGDGTHKWSELSYAKADLVKSDVTTALGYTPPTSNTWRGIQNNLTSTSTTDSLSAAQGKILKGLVDGKLSLAGGTMTGPVKWNGNDSLPQFSDAPKYLVGIEPFADDGTMKWQRIESIKVGAATSADSANAAPWSGITGKPSTFTPSSHKQAYTASECTVYTADDNTMGVTAAAVKKAFGIFEPKAHTHNYAGSASAGGSATSAVKLDTATAGSATQPVYFSGGKPVACTYTLAKSVPADAKFTDTNTWRGVQNNLTSTATDQSLAAAQGKVLNEAKMGAVSANGFYGMARPDGNTSDWIRTTSNGIIPIQNGARGSGHGGIGTSSWYFSSSYIDHMYSTDVKIADKVLLQYDSTNACLNFVFS